MGVPFFGARQRIPVATPAAVQAQRRTGMLEVWVLKMCELLYC